MPEISNWKFKFTTIGKFSVFGLRKPGTSVQTPSKNRPSIIRRLFRNVPGSKWQLLTNVLAHVGKTGETAVNWNNLRPWIGLFQGAKCDNVPKCDLEFA